MKLRNKNTGEIADLAKRWLLKSDNDNHIIVYPEGTLKYYAYESLAELNKEWEDAPSTVWYITHDGSIHSADIGNSWTREKAIGNYFESREEAEKAVEKLKAWKRLKDRGFKVDTWDYDGGNYQERIKTGRILFRVKDYEDNDRDLDLLFRGGEE